MNNLCPHKIIYSFRGCPIMSRSSALTLYDQRTILWIVMTFFCDSTITRWLMIRLLLLLFVVVWHEFFERVREKAESCFNFIKCLYFRNHLSRVWGIHKLRWLDFEDLWPLSSLRWQVYSISLCHIVGICWRTG